MQRILNVISLLILLLAIAPLKAATEISSADKPSASQSKTSNSARYAGYSVDGRTSASVIAAKRSHTVSASDERGLAIYSGLIVISLIAFFAHQLNKLK